VDQTGIRQGFVSLKRGDKNIITVHGLDILGWGESGQRAIQRKVFVDPNAPQWFRRWCELNADSAAKVKVNCTRTVGHDKAFVGPMASTLVEMISSGGVYVRNYSPKEIQLPVHVISLAFEHHHEVANARMLKVVENVEEGVSSYTLAEDPLSAKRFKIIGGMLVCKAVFSSSGMNPAQIAKARRVLIRVKEL